MAWLHTSFLRYQAHDGVGSNIKKGYKVASNEKGSDLEKSDTPLLQEMSSTTNEKFSSQEWAENKSLPSKCHALTKTNLSMNPAKFSSNAKLKSKEMPSGKCAGQTEKLMGDKNLLSFKEKNIEDEDEDDDSEDEWGFSSNGGYQKVRSNAD